MKIIEVVKRYAETVGGNFSTYDDSKSAVVIPIGQHRHQTVLAETKSINGCFYLALSSKISNKEAISDVDIYEKQKNLLFGKLVIEKNHLEIRAYLEENMSEKLIAEIFNEIAAFADIYEKRFTGKDIY
ncbi:MAG: hypothetical protein L3J29_10335 [Cyclobacteriaceae bacterium]|nr:hypothetical protein [Cyclobacteriaceae bacterium]